MTGLDVLKKKSRRPDLYFKTEITISIASHSRALIATDGVLGLRKKTALVHLNIFIYIYIDETQRMLNFAALTVWKFSFTVIFRAPLGRWY